MLRSILASSLALAAGGLGISFATQSNATTSAGTSATALSMAALANTANPSILETATSAGKFNTLAAAIEKAGLLNTLSGSGPFTVLAPSDDAFAKLGNSVNDLLKPENLPRLRQILTYHVIPGRISSADLIKTRSADTVNGQRLNLTLNEGRLTIGDTKFSATDIQCSNGVIHIIDSVLIPAKHDIVSAASNLHDFRTLVTAVKAAGLAETLSGPGPFTVFAPTNEAFAKVPKDILKKLLLPENKETLSKILTYHVVAGRAYASDAASLSKAATVAGEEVKFALNNGRLRINDSNITRTDMDTSNGVIHIIDTVLIPPSVDLAALASTPSSSSSIGSASSSGSGTDLINLAIERGVPLFNDGNPAACAAIYEVALVALLDRPSLPGDARTMITSALSAGREQVNASDRAWTFRTALDKLAEMPTMMAPARRGN
ncbi:MAG: fasciclin domain-containing protein [Planctomycetes bacterium]|nr:fasciclin domain-containing protein [Planctomycetota bacterium]